MTLRDAQPGEAIDVDGRRWIVAAMRHGVLKLEACRRRRYERTRPTRYVLVESGAELARTRD